MRWSIQVLSDIVNEGLIRLLWTCRCSPRDSCAVMVSLFLATSIWGAISFVIVLQVHYLSCPWLASMRTLQENPWPCPRPQVHLFHHNHNNLSMVKIWTRNAACSSCEWQQIKPIHSDFIQTGLCGPRQKKTFYEHKSTLTALAWEVIILIGCGPLEKFDKFEVVERTSDCKLDELYNPGEIYVGFGEERKTHSHHYVHSTR